MCDAYSDMERCAWCEDSGRFGGRPLGSCCSPVGQTVQSQDEGSRKQQDLSFLKVILGRTGCDLNCNHQIGVKMKA